MKLIAPSILVLGVAAAMPVSAELQLPHAVSADLTSEQVNANLQYLTTEANKAVAAIADLQKVKTVPVLERMTAVAESDLAAEKTLFTSGPISVKASCILNNNTDTTNGIELRLWTESTNVGALVVTDEDYSGYYRSESEVANAPLVATWFDDSTSSENKYILDNSIDQGSTVAPSGEVILMDGETFTYGINIQGSDCLLAGQIFAFKGEAAPAFTVPSEQSPVLK